jgi:hypothetical protein
MSSRTKRPLEATELVGSMQPGSTRDDDALTRDHGAPTLREMAGRSSRAKRKPGSERSTRGHARRCRGGRRGRWKRRSPRSASSPGARGTPTRDQGEEERGEGEPSCHPCGGASRSPCRGRARRCCARRGRRKRDDVVHWATCRRSFTTQSRVRGDDTTQPRAAPWHILTNDVFRDTINGAEVTRKILPLNLSCSRCCQASGRSRAGVVRRPNSRVAATRRAELREKTLLMTMNGGATPPASAAPVLHARSWRTIAPPTQYAEKYSLFTCEGCALSPDRAR